VTASGPFHGIRMFSLSPTHSSPNDGLMIKVASEMISNSLFMGLVVGKH